MAFTVGINKNMGQMFEDLETLMLQEGWEKLSRNTIGSFTTSRGYKYTATANVQAVEGKYSDTVGIRMGPGQSFSHATIVSEASETFYNDYPTEFSLSFWVNLSRCRSIPASPYHTSGLLTGAFETTSVKRRGVDILFDKDWSLGPRMYSFSGLMYYMKYYFNDKTGRSWEHFTFTYSNVNNEVKLYINGTYIESVTLRSSSRPDYTTYGAIYNIAASSQTKTIDEFIIWNKVLTQEEINTLYLKPTKVEATDPYVFEKYTNDIGVLFGGIYKSTSTQGTTSFISVKYNVTNNIELATYSFVAQELSQSLDFYNYTPHVGKEGTLRVLAGVSANSSTLKKYWLVVNKDRVIISYKLYDPTATRTTPLYQTGYAGKIKSLGNDGTTIFTAGTTNSGTYLWTTLDATNFRSGVLYSSNNSVRYGMGYYNASMGTINTTLASLKSISNSTFLAGINVSYSTTMLGSLDGVFGCSYTQASPEDLITINSQDYVVLPDADSGSGVYYLVVKLS